MTAPLIVIVGPTASGKTAAAITAAQLLNGEILCADSRTIYKDTDIGTAKPSLAEQQGVIHWGLDLVYPGERFTAADFKQYAEQVINDIRSRGKTPVMVGGTGLYIDAVLFDYQFPPDSHSQREALMQWTMNELYKYCTNNNINLPYNYKNKRHVVQAILQSNINLQRRNVPASNSIIVGIATDKEELRTRIRHRAEQMFEHGVVDEAIKLGKLYGWDSEAMTGNIYRLLKQHLEGTLTRQQVNEQFITLDYRLAKRQMTWFKRNKYITWAPREDAVNSILRQVESNFESWYNDVHRRGNTKKND
ncbi:tRNA dimethylallyltransferase [Candidatus Saccharibacteria bacterium]|nr:tRNA dimethylallyltransferase [Candidatus Saccharibacteria bacterium]